MFLFFIISVTPFHICEVVQESYFHVQVVTLRANESKIETGTTLVLSLQLQFANNICVIDACSVTSRGILMLCWMIITIFKMTDKFMGGDSIRFCMKHGKSVAKTLEMYRRVLSERLSVQFQLIEWQIAERRFKGMSIVGNQLPDKYYKQNEKFKARMRTVIEYNIISVILVI